MPPTIPDIRAATAGALALCAATVAMAPRASGAGIWIYEDGTMDMGLAGAGRGARAGDAVTAFRNPAGMGWLDRKEVVSGFNLSYIDARFRPGPGTNRSGGGGGNAGGAFPIPSLYYVHPLGKRWRVGLSLNSYFAATIKYDPDWAGRYYATKSSFITTNATLSVSFRPRNWISVGAGVGPQLATTTARTSINNIFGRDGSLQLDGTSVSVVAFGGVMIEPLPGTRIGVTYISPVHHRFGDALSVQSAVPLPAFEVDFKVTLPQQVLLSVYHEFSPTFAVLGSVGWQDWSRFGYDTFVLRSTVSADLTIDRKLRDSWHFSVGVIHKPTARLTLTAGVAYDTAAADTANRTAGLPVDRQIRVAGGIRFAVTPSIAVGFAYEFIDLGKASLALDRGVLAGRVEGDFKTNVAHNFGVNLRWRFGGPAR